MKVLFKISAILTFLLLSFNLSARVDIIHISTNDPLCFGGNDGYVTIDSLTTTAPSGNYTIRINTTPTQFFNVGDTIPLRDGNYTITVFDGNDGNTPSFRSFSIDEPFQLVTAAFSGNASCFNVCDGSVTVLAFDGTPGYTYVWNDPGNSTTNTVTGLCDGTYRVTVTDANGCTAVDSATVSEPTLVVPNVSVDSVRCFGGSTGIATANPTGGSGTYTNYVWSSTPTNNSNVENGLSANTYSITVTDSDGCTGTESFTILEPAAPLTVTLDNKGNANCFNEPSAFINVNVSGGTIPYNFLWSDGDLNEDRPNILAGSYTLTVTDFYGCTATITETVTQPAGISVDSTVTPVSCNGGSDGAILLSVTGGTGTTTLSWSTGAGNVNPLTGLSANKYFVTITDANACTVVDSAVVPEPPVLTVTEDSKTDPSCNGGSDGTINISVAGGTPNYAYNWSDIGPTPLEDRTGLPAGNYTVTVTDNNNCTASLTVTLNNPAPILPNVTPSPVLCRNDNTGSATANPSGGSGVYVLFAWSNGANGQTINNLGAGAYRVTVTDDEGCTGSANFNITEPATVVSASIPNQVNVFCFGASTGSATAQGSGGTEANTYDFLWSDPGAQTTATATNLTAGLYTVTVTDDNGCTTTASTTITTSTEISIQLDSTDVSCNGGNDGTATANISGGNPPYSFAWSEGTNGNGASSTISNLSANKYFITVTDNQGCTRIDSIVVNEPTLLVASVNSISDPLCTNDNNGTIDISVNGGTQPYTFAWSDAGPTTEDRNSLSAGSYTVTVTDALGCTATADTTLTNPLLLTVVIDSTVNPSCNGGSDGFARALASGGTGAYTYDWSNVAGSNNNRSNPGLIAGPYFVTVTDANNCTATTSVTLTDPLVLTASINGFDASCNGVNDGSAVASATGGTSPYSFDWDNGVTNNNTITGLGIGIYTVTVTDNQGCTDTETVTISQPNSISFSLDSTRLICNGDNSGTATVVNPSGGSAPFTFQWDDPANQTTQTATGLSAGLVRVTVSDQNGCTNVDSILITEPTVLTATITNAVNPSCNGINDGSVTVSANGGTVAGNYSFLWSDPSGQTTATASNLGSGSYTVTITDDNGCTVTADTTIQAPPSVVISQDTIINVACKNDATGEIRITISGGSPGYNFLWSDNGSTSEDRNGLTDGSYTVTVTDQNGCIDTRTFNVTEPAQILSIQTDSTRNVTCNNSNDGFIAITPIGGVSPYNFNWNNGALTEDINTLNGGTYEVTVTDDNGCTATQTFVISEPNALTISTVSVTPANCSGSTDGAATISGNGGNPPYSFNWSNGGTGTSQTNLAGGTYLITITDNNLCTGLDSVTIPEPDTLLINLDVQNNVSCNGAGDGSLTVSSQDGTPPYNFSWSHGPTNTGLTSTVNNLIPGAYTVTVQDSRGCDTTQTFTITQPNVLAVSLSVTDEQCSSNNDGQIVATVTGGTPTYAYNWAGSGGTTDTIKNLSPGPYSLTVTDQNGCTVVANDTVRAADTLIVTAAGAAASCFGESSGTLVATTLGGAAPLSFAWSNGRTGSTVNNVAAGTYVVTVTDGNGCTDTASATVTQPTPIVDNLIATGTTCSGVNDGSASSTPSGGVSPYDFNWSNGTLDNNQLSSSISNLAAGNYDVTITDAQGCDTIIAFTINQGAVNFTIVDTLGNDSCFNQCIGFVNITSVGGGTGPYNFAWENGVGTGTSASNLCAGSYDLTITDASGCDTVITYTITEPAQLVANEGSTPESCSPGNDGTAFVNPTGGTSPYSFDWSNGGGNVNQINNLTAGTYDVTVTDTNGCSVTASINVAVQGGLVVTDSINNISCNGANDGSIFLTVTGTSGTPTFQWDNGLPAQATQTSLAANTYNVTVSDPNNGCSQTASYTITEPSAIQATLTPSNASCNPGGDGSINLSVTGGTVAVDYTYSWSNGASTANISGLNPGTYVVTITDDNNCTLIDSATVGGGNSNITLTSNITQASCSGICDGGISLTPTGGTSPYQFNWDNSANTNPINGLCAGTYRVTVTDAVGCTKVDSFTVTNISTILANLTSTPDTCIQGLGTATANPSGGVGPYLVNWSTGSNSNTITGLSQGNYQVTVSDSRGCSALDTIEVTNEATFTISLVPTPVSCFGGNDGTISVSTVGGVNPLTYNWTGGLSGAFPSNVRANNYTITVTDNAGCSQIATTTVTQPDELEIGDPITTTPESCFPGRDGTATASVTGGTQPYTYLWPSGSSSSNTTNGLNSGTYILTVTDANGCADSRDFAIGSVGAFTTNVDTTSAGCAGGTNGAIDLTITGGIPPFTFNWSAGLPPTEDQTGLSTGTYFVTITDATPCSEVKSILIEDGSSIEVDVMPYDDDCLPGDSGSAKATVTGGTPPFTFTWAGNGTPLNDSVAGLKPGSYSVTVTDDNGCTAVKGFPILSGSNLVANETIVDVSCFNGSDGVIRLNPSGSTNPNPVYSYQWANGTTADTLANLSQGFYTVTITDNNVPPCSKIESFQVQQPNQIFAVINRTPEGCNPGNDGSAVVQSARGGTPPYVYFFSAGVANNNTVTGLSVGNYDVTVEDDNGCQRVFPFTINQAPNFTVTLTSTDAKCNGGNDGTISTNVVGATNPLTYNWSGGIAGGATPTAVSAGTYTVTVTDNFGCTGTATTTVGEATAIVSNLVPVDASCNPGNDGSASVNPTSGVPPYVVNWSTGTTGNSVSNLSPGNYTVSVTDDSLCTIVEQFTISTGRNIIITANIDSVSCRGNCDGNIRLNVTGGSSPYNYNWDSGQNTTQLLSQCAGSYTVTVTDALGCSNIETYEIGEPDSIIANLNTTIETCVPGNDARANITSITGGTSPYVIDWSDGTQGTSANNLSAGAYSLTITDANNCTQVQNFTINGSTPLTINELRVDEVSCNGGSDGIIFIEVIGNTSPVTYSWSNGLPPFKDAFNLSAGTYSVTATDPSNGCTASRSFVVNEPDPISVTEVVNPESCIPGNDGNITLTVTGGTINTNYSFAWSNGLPPQSSVTGLNSGTYSYTVTDDNNCTFSNTVTVGSVAPFTLDSNITNVSCFGGSDGAIGLVVTGANGTPTYQWSNSLGTTDSVDNLVAGIYRVTVTDPANGCTEVAVISVNEPDSIGATFNAVSESCVPGNDGSLTVSPNGGNAPYTVNWFNGSNSLTVSSLSAGAYNITITDANGCTNVLQGNVGSRAPFSLTDTLTNVSCNGGNDGRIALGVVGSAQPPTFTWDKGLPPNSVQTGLSAGTYSVTVTDPGNGCTETASYTLTEPTGFTVTVTTTDESCTPGNDGTATASVSGASGSLSFAWSSGSTNSTAFLLSAGTYTVTVTDATGCSKTAQGVVNSQAPFTVDSVLTNISCNGGSDGIIDLTINGSSGSLIFNWDNSLPAQEDQTNLSAGTYKVTITDAILGCRESFTFSLSEPNPIQASSTSVDANCGACDGSATIVNPRGGTGTININWLDASKTPIGQTGRTASSLCPGTYFAALEDANNCVDTILVQVNNQGGPQATIFFTNESCSNACDGSVWLTGTCIGSGNCSIEWTDINGTVIGTNDTIRNLCAGTYLAKITDNNTNCITNLQTIVGTGSIITPNLVTENDKCSAATVCEGYAKVSPTGGTAPYSFDWAGPGLSINGVDSIGSLCAGSYSVTITDNSGCDTTLTFTINSGSDILPNEFVIDELCPNSCDGEIRLNPTGGVAPYSYNWSNGAGNVSSVSNLCSGNYRVTVTDALQCDTVLTVAITTPTFSYTLSKTNLSCNGGCDGTASLSINGSTNGISYNWAPSPINGQGTQNVTDLCAGKYFVTITTGRGCVYIDSVDILPDTPILPGELLTNESCSGGCDGRIDLNPTGGAGGPYTYNWSPIPPNGQGVQNATGLCGGTYNVTITDAANCDTSITVDILPAGSITASVNTFDQSCGGPSAVCDGSASATVSGGNAPYTFSWPTGNVVGTVGDTISDACAGSYTLTITDASGCSVTENFVINAPTAISATFNTTNATCNICDGSITATVTGAVPTFTYQWLDQSLNPIGSNSPTLSNLCAGIYFLDITDGNGCNERFATSVNDIGSEALTISGTDVTCGGTCDGTATVSFNCTDPSCIVEWIDASTGNPIGATDTTANNLCAGTYFARVTNNSKCQSFAQITINEPNAFNVSSILTDLSCNSQCDGAITVNVNGGSGNYSYNWSPSPSNGQGTSSISGLCAGTYQLTLTDGSGCDSVLSFTLNQPASLTATFTTANAGCGQANGIINATVNGGTVASDYSYQWYDGNNSLIAGAVSPTLLNVAAGVYFLEVTDDNLCQETFTTSLASTNGPTITLDSISNVICNGDFTGSVNVTVTGANGPFTYNWLPLGQTTEDLTNVPAGVYTLLATNSNGCVSRDTFAITEPTEMLANINTQDANCGVCDGTADIQINGGTGPYNFLWSNGSTSTSADSLCGGTHSVEVTDANGCKKTFNFTINTTNGPDNISVTATGVSCASSCDGTAFIQPSGGTTPYTYLWLHNGSTSNGLNNLCAGSYTVQVSDASGCAQNVNVQINGPAPLSILETVQANSCQSATCEGSIRLNVTGGFRPYTYQWGPTPQNDTNYIGGLCAGVYQVTVTDANFCTAIKTINVSDDSAPVNAQPTVTDATCAGTCDGSLESNITPSSAISYQWLDDQGNSIGAPDADVLNSVCAGNYILEVTELNLGCKSYFNVTVDESDSIRLAASVVKNIACAGDCNGEIFISTTGGNLLYNYSWDDSNSQTQIPAVGLCAGTYSVTATDASGCSSTTSVTLVDPPVLSLTINSSTSLGCSSDCNASADVIASGGIPPYTYTWSGGQSGTSPNTLCFGPNIISVQDAVGCVITDTVNIAATDTVVAIIPTQTVFCDGDSIRLNGSTLGSGVTSAAWYVNDPSTLFTNTADTTISRNIGTYRFYYIASDGINCSDTSLYEFEVAANPQLSLPATAKIVDDEVLNITLGGKDNSYTYSWSPGTALSDSTIAEPIASPQEDITYVLTVLDTNGCTFIDSIMVDYVPKVEIPSAFTPNGDGTNDTWEITLLDEYPNAKVQVFNRWGQLLYEQDNGYTTPWNGEYNGENLPVGTYYYVIDLKDGVTDPISGPITIIR